MAKINININTNIKKLIGLNSGIFFLYTNTILIVIEIKPITNTNTVIIIITLGSKQMLPTLFYIHAFVSWEYNIVVNTSNTIYNDYWFK